MTVNYFNLFLAIIGIAASLACVHGPGIVIKKLQYVSQHMEWIMKINIIYLIAVASESYFEGRAGMIPFAIVNVANFLEYVLLLVLSFLVIFNMGIRIKENGLAQVDVRPFLYIFAPGFFLLGVNLFNKMYYYIGNDNIYHRGKYFLVSQIIGAVCHLNALAIFWKYRKALKQHDRYFFSAFILLPLIAIVLQIFSKGINVMAITTTICCIIVSIGSVIFWNNFTLKKMEQLRQMEVAVKFGNIRQAFLQNILADISQLCKIEPMKASLVIDQFSEYLRKSIDDMNRQGSTCPFADELKHLENYISLETIRYGEDLEVNYDIEDTDFEIPTQVLVRTADIILKYSMEQSEDVFSMTVHSCKTEDGYLVEFYEDNLGRSLLREQTEDELMDLEDIRTRLSIIPHARLEYDNIEDYGIIIKIYL